VEVSDDANAGHAAVGGEAVERRRVLAGQTQKSPLGAGLVVAVDLLQ